ncbi:hypothetical protein [Phnomibacter sp. MR]
MSGLVDSPAQYWMIAANNARHCAGAGSQSCTEWESVFSNPIAAPAG